MSMYTCITCRVAFADAELQRGHYKTDWHRYNLKRKVAELPPVTAENFQQRVLAQRAQDAEQNASSATYCTLCGKHFSTQNAFDNHVKSKKHREIQAKHEQQTSEEVEKQNVINKEKGEETETEKHSKKNTKNAAQPASASGSVSTSASASGSSSVPAAGSSSAKVKASQGGSQKSRNVEAMETNADDDSDADSEEEWDGEALGEEECLFCSYASKSLQDNVAHMTAKHSFFIPDIEYLVDLEGLIVYLGQKVGEGHMCLWCNEKSKMFTSIKGVQQHMVDKGHTKMLHEGDAVFEYADYYDYRSSYPDHGQRGSGDDSGDEEEEEDVEQDMLEEDNYQLVLPSGSTIGHRSLQRYFRQKLKPTRVVNPNAVSKVIAQYKALGWTGSTGSEAEKRAKDVHYVQRVRARKDMKMGMKNNSLLQKHYRMQVIF